MKIDVVILTKNSCSRIGEGMFRKCIASIKKNIPVNNLIVIDAFSSDNTIKIIKEYFPDALIIETRAKRGKAREIGIKKVSTDYFMFVGSDIIVPKDYFKKVLEKLESDRIGAIGGVAIPTDLTLWRIYYCQQILRLQKEVVHIDGNNVIIKTSCVSDRYIDP